MEKKKKKKKWIIITIVVVVVLIGGLGGGSDDTSQTETVETETTKAEEIKPSRDAKKLAKKHEIDALLAEDFIKSCEKIDIEYDDVEISKASQKSIDFSYEDYLFNTTCAGNKVTTIVSGTITFYDPANKVKINIWDRLVTTDELITLSVRAEMLVESVLKAPSTADFPSTTLEVNEWNIRKNGDKYILTSWVDAENSFGAMVRSNYAIEYNWNGDEDTEPEVISFIFDGETII